MISIKKYLDMKPAPAASAVDASGIASLVLSAYRAAIGSMAANASRACPPIGSDLQQALNRLQLGLEEKSSSTLIRDTQQQLTEQLDSWGTRADSYFKAKASEVKELLIAMAHTAQSMGERDQRYTDQLGEFTRQLHTIADLEDLGQVRRSLVQQAAQLKGCIDQMAEESRRAITKLKTEVSQYETRLREAETLASKDDLTGLFNRRSMEQRIEVAMESQRPFCVVMVDLNGFKQVNDTHGHAAGDSLLTQFAQELRTNVRSSDIVGRWGGDEFVLLLEGNLASTQGQIERIQKWVFGEYTLAAGQGSAPVKLQVRASVGAAEWQGEKLNQLIERADRAMYQEKKRARKQHA